ncbi:SpoIIE family protein phosphatase [Umezawaea endophytica]|uniref:SpoIIE family protein phosphatase n=1 Tax=Umezawaea endophytica TaxID=1654476 RepID=A0A9X3A636_9PSEU|nr:SpoIIE family protein phosphatase [Umezawaea endophytica]MCS7482968.1 SpoIIE family protein phosphatase [Umezawaea endophytica]
MRHDDDSTGGTDPLRGARSVDDADIRSLFGQSSAAFAMLSGPAHVVEAANHAFFDAIGGGERVRMGVPIGQLAPELAGQGVIALLDGVYRTGRPCSARDARIVLGAADAVGEAYFDFIYEPRRDTGGNVTGVLLLAVETTQTRHAQRLIAEHRALLEQIARQAPLREVLDGMARVIEHFTPGTAVSVLLADEDGRHLRHGAAPSLPDFYNEAIDGIATGEGIGSCGTAAHRRRPVVVSDIAADPFWADFRELAAAASLAACWSTPILARDGRLLGTFAMYHRTPRHPEETDLALARVFTDTAALAIERHHAERAQAAAEAKEKAARDDLAFLLAAGTALAQCSDYAQILQCLADICVPALAPLCAIDVVDAGGARRIAAAALTAPQADLLASCRSDTDVVARVLSSATTEVARRAPAGLDPWDDLAVAGYLCVPLSDRGQAFGTLTLLTTDDGPPLDGHAVHLAEELASRASPLARNARQYTERVQMSRDLQAGLLLPDLPELPGAELATHYHPAGEGLEIGGDFYDVFPLPDGQWAFLIGDVCGRGAKAATTTALVRHTARAVARLLPEPHAVVRAVNTALLDRASSHGSGFVTLVYGHLRDHREHLAVDFIRAGHVAPRLVLPDGTVSVLEVPGMLLGVTPDPRLHTHHVDLKPGESLVLVTDGITEARTSTGSQFDDAGLDTALGHVVHPSAEGILDALITAVTAFTDGQVGEDDQAALVLTALSPDRR